MAKPPTSVRSIRLPDSMWAELGEMAGEATTVNALVQVAVRRLLTPEAAPPQPAKVAKTPAERHLLEQAVSFGPQRAKFGERLKGAKK